MADVKISALPLLSTILPSDVVPIVSSGTTYKITGNTLGYTDTGEFTTATLVAGDVYVSDNILTTLPTYNVYGNPVEQPLVVNGNLSVIGNVSGSLLGSSFDVAIGYQAGIGQLSDTVAIGNRAAEVGQLQEAIAIGHSAGGANQQIYAIAIGHRAGYNNQDRDAISIGDEAGQDNQGNYSVAVGYQSGTLNQGNHSVAIGPQAGMLDQAQDAIAIGLYAGESQQAAYGIAIGRSAAGIGQQQNGIAIGRAAGYLNQANNAIAIGQEAGSANSAIYGANSISIGNQAGVSAVGNSSMVLNSSGLEINCSGANSIVLNATTPATTTINQANSFFVNPVRQVSNSGNLPSGFYNMAYNPTTKEVIYFS